MQCIIQWNISLQTPLIGATSLKGTYCYGPNRTSTILHRYRHPPNCGYLAILYSGQVFQSQQYLDCTPENADMYSWLSSLKITCYCYLIRQFDVILCYYRYSGTPLMWTPWGPGKVSSIERYLHFRGKFTCKKEYLGHSKVFLIQRCPYFRGVL